MSDFAVTALTAITGTNVNDVDVMPLVDVSDASMAATGTDKRITARELSNYMARVLPGVGAVYNDRGVVANSTTYAKWDMVLLTTGLQVVALQTFVSSSTGAVAVNGSDGHPNYFTVQAYQIVPAYLTGVRPGNGASVNTLALAVAFSHANPTGALVVGRMVELPYGLIAFGQSTADGTAAIHVPYGCGMYGQGRQGTYIQLANGANCSFIRLHTSTGSGNANAFFCHLYNFGMDCRGPQQGTQVNDVTLVAASSTITSPTFVWPDNYYVIGTGILPDTKIVAGSQTNGGHDAVMTTVAQQSIASIAIVWAVGAQCFGILCRTNPLGSNQTGDWAFDPGHIIEGLYIKNCLMDAIRIEGRSAISVRNNFIEQCWSNGIVASFDTVVSDNNVGILGWHCIVLNGSSTECSNNKTYNSGNYIGGAGGQFNLAYGIVANGLQGVTIGNNNAQECAGSSYKFIGCKSVKLDGLSERPGFMKVGTLGAVGAFHIELDNSYGCIINLTGVSCGTDTGQTPSTARAYRLVNGSNSNSLTISHLGLNAYAPGPAQSADTALLNNHVTVNGVAINAPGLVSSATVATAIPKPYARTSTTGGNFYTPGVQTTAVAATLNRAEFMPLALSDRAGQTITTLIMRVGGAGVATAVFRAGIYTSDYSGADTWVLLGELPSQFDASSSGVKTITFTTPLAVDLTLLNWTCIVPQVALGATFAGSAGPLVASGNSLGATAALANNVGFSGALPATVAWGTGAAPVGVTAAIQVTAVVLG